MRGLLTILVVVATSMWAQAVGAQECCSALADDELGVVFWDDQAAVTMSAAARQVVGGYDQTARLQREEGERGTDIVARLGGGFRPGLESLQLYGGLPVQLSYRSDSESSAWGLGPGDSFVGIRWTVLRDLKTGIHRGIGASRRPFVDLYIESVFPTGREASESVSVLGEDIRGRGDFEGLVGARVSKYLSYQVVVSGFAQAGAGLSQREFQWAKTASAGLSYLKIHSPTWSYGGSAEIAWRERATLRDRQLGASISGLVRYGFSDPRWRLQLQVGTDSFGPIGGINQGVAGPLVEVGVTRRF